MARQITLSIDVSWQPELARYFTTEATEYTDIVAFSFGISVSVSFGKWRSYRWRGYLVVTQWATSELSIRYNFQLLKTFFQLFLTFLNFIGHFLTFLTCLEDSGLLFWLCFDFFLLFNPRAMPIRPCILAKQLAFANSFFKVSGGSWEKRGGD
jgi:hypothetical protein